MQTVVVNDTDRDDLYSSLASLSCNPYKNYQHFRNVVADFARSSSVNQNFRQTCKTISQNRTSGGELAYLIRNCPIDVDRPIFDQNDPVSSKYEKKKTFVGEALLELFANLSGTPLLAYATRNNGDFFHDVYAHNRYTKTQTQKTDGELYFHNDRTAHPVRADYLSLLGMRSFPDNRIYTGYIDGRKILEYLTKEHQELLRQPLYWTPYDEYSKDSNRLQVSSKPHAILEEEHCFRYYETRTRPLPSASVAVHDAFIELKDSIIKAEKCRVRIQEGDLCSIPNQAGLHNREIIELACINQAKIRWLLKTYSFRSEEKMQSFSNAFTRENEGSVCDLYESEFSA